MIKFPSGTEFDESFFESSVTDSSTRQQVGDDSCTAFLEEVTCSIQGNVAAGNTVAVELDRATNPGSPNDDEKLGLETSSDAVLEPSESYRIEPASASGPATVSDASVSSAAGALTDYSVAFATSGTGGLSGVAGSEITVTFPAETGLEGSLRSTSVTDTTSRQELGSECSPSGTVLTCVLTSGVVSAGDSVSVQLDGVVNPGSPNGGETVEVKTSSDKTVAVSNIYSVTSRSHTSEPIVENSSPSSAPGAPTVYSIAFTTSPTGGLSNSAGSEIAVALPAGTGLESLLNSTVTDTTTRQQVGYCNERVATTERCYLYGTIAAGDAVTVELDGITNPPTTTPETLQVSTTSDTVAATSAPYGVGAPVAVTGSASNILATEAFVTGTVNPDGTPVSDCYFEWGPSTSYGQSVPCSQVLGSGNANEPVSAALTGLTANTIYHFRLAATNAGGTSYGDDQMFATEPSILSTSAPSVLATVSAVVSSESATFSGLVDPGGLATTAYFEYGLDPEYSGGGPVSYDQVTPTQLVGSDFAGHSVSAAVSGLVPDALYHVRLLAANGGGTTVGPDQTFTTASSAAPSPPTLGHTVNAEPVEGLVLVKLPAGGHAARAASVTRAHDALAKGEGFVPLTQTRQLPVGTEIDARRGTLQLIVATSQRHHTHAAKLSGGLFTVSQQRTGVQKGLTTLTLDEGLFPGAPSYESCGSGKAAKVASRARGAKLSAHIVQTLEASDNHGQFRTSGRYSASTVRGTSWKTSDRCDGTLTAVRRGTVEVLDFASRKTIVLHAGQSYLASAPCPQLSSRAARTWLLYPQLTRRHAESRAAAGSGRRAR